MMVKHCLLPAACCLLILVLAAPTGFPEQLPPRRSAPALVVSPPPLPPLPGGRRPTPPPPTASPQPVHISADYMRYDRKSKKAFAKGNVVIQQEDTTIYTDEVQYDQDANISYVNVPLRAIQLEKDTRRPTALSGRRGTAYHEEKRLIIEGEVTMDRAASGEPPDRRPATGKNRRARIEKALKRERSVITADQLEYWTKKKDAVFTGHVQVVQRDKKAWGDRAVSLDKEQTITLQGNVKLLQIKGDWLVEEGIVDTGKKDEERDKALQNPLTITCDTLVIDQRTNNASATGNVHADQVVEGKRRTADGERADYVDKTQQLTLTGKVRLARDGEWLQADRIVLHTETDVFEAFAPPGGRVTSVFKVEEKKK